MTEEQVTEDNTQSEKSYEELYNEGFDDKSTLIESEEEVLEQPEEVEEDDTTPETDETEEETIEATTTEDSNTIELEYKGQVINVTPEEAKVLAQKGFDYTSKTQDLASKRKLIELAEEYEVDEELIVALGDAKRGNKEALAMLANKFNIDPYELDSEVAYKPVVKDKNYDLDDTIKAIQSDTENGSMIDNWINSLPSTTTSKFASEPAILRALHTDSRKGISQKIMPEVIKQLALDPSKDFVSVYQSVGNDVFSKEESARPEASRETKKKVSVSKKKSTAHSNDHKDVWEDDELYRQMQRMRNK